MNSSPETLSTPEHSAEPVAPVASPRPAALEVRLERRWMIVLAITLALVITAATVGGIRSLLGLRREDQAREQLAAIHGELIRIRQILETEPDSDDDDDTQVERTATLSTSGSPILGSPNAPLTLVEFTDFQCPFCARFHSETFPRLRKAYVDSGRMRYITMDFPLTELHPDAYRAARASHCGEAQGHYWELHESLYRQRGQLGRAEILSAISGLGLNTQRFAACLDSDANDGRIEQG